MFFNVSPFVYLTFNIKGTILFFYKIFQNYSLHTHSTIIGSVNLYLLSSSFSIKSLESKASIAFCAPPIEHPYFSRYALAWG